MKNDELYEAIINIDDKYIMKADKYSNRTITWYKWVVPACLCFFIVGAALIFSGKSNNTDVNISNKNNHLVINKLEPSSDYSQNVSREWKKPTEEYLKANTEVIIKGTIESKDEYSYYYRGEYDELLYRTVLKVKIDDTLYGECMTDDIYVLYELTSYTAGEFGVENLPQAGESYYFFLKFGVKDAEKEFTQMYDYENILPAPDLIKVDGELSIEMKESLNYKDGDDIEKVIIEFFEKKC